MEARSGSGLCETILTLCTVYKTMCRYHMCLTRICALGKPVFYFNSLTVCNSYHSSYTQYSKSKHRSITQGLFTLNSGNVRSGSNSDAFINWLFPITSGSDGPHEAQ